MKKLALLLIIALTIPFSSPVFSQEEEEKVTPETTPTSTDDKIEELKEKVAQRVSELKKGKSTGLFGTVKSATEEALILTTENGEYSIQLDEDSKVYSIDLRLRKTDTTLTDLEKNSTVSVIGVVDEDEKTAIATVIVSRTPNVIIAGQVNEVSTKDGTITILDNESNSHIVDIETTTTINSYDPEKNTQSKLGLSAIEKDSNVIAYVIPTDTETLTGIRILILPNTFESSPTPTIEPSPDEEEGSTPTTIEEE